MNIAIASGKGGTGKTTVAVNLAWILSRVGEKVRYLDCDVEEPNGHLFLKPRIRAVESAAIPVPVIDISKCVACGECVKLCQYNALVRLGKTVMVFEELCHGCGGCMRICPDRAITEKDKTIGVVEIGDSGEISFVHGLLNVGEAMSPPLIRAVLTHQSNDTINIIDAPPGTSCPVIAAVRSADFVVLVTEPTPFGLHDLGLALDMIRELNLPHAVIVNRSDPDNADARIFCDSRHVAILSEIPDDRRIAEAYSRGEIICDTVPDIAGCFVSLWDRIKERVAP
ncbi:MAG: ATP-binding protein [Chitinispirillaceae bacterium]|jgi:MinD superfamily P-loop ATPase|nr:ATP-binding protein [Chitinispirillaceae bacterium]